MFFSPNTKIISVQINPSGGNTPASVTFPTQEDLINRKIVSIECFSVLEMPLDPLNPGVVNLSQPVFQGGFLTLYTSAVKNPNNFSKDQEPGLFYEKVPLVALRRIFTPLATSSQGSVYERFIIRPTEINFNKTKVEFPNTIAMANPMSAIFMFTYLDMGDDGTNFMQALGFPAGALRR